MNERGSIKRKARLVSADRICEKLSCTRAMAIPFGIGRPPGALLGVDRSMSPFSPLASGPCLFWALMNGLRNSEKA